MSDQRLRELERVWIEDKLSDAKAEAFLAELLRTTPIPIPIRDLVSAVTLSPFVCGKGSGPDLAKRFIAACGHEGVREGAVWRHAPAAFVLSRIYGYDCSDWVASFQARDGVFIASQVRAREESERAAEEEMRQSILAELEAQQPGWQAAVAAARNRTLEVTRTRSNPSQGEVGYCGTVSDRVSFEAEIAACWGGGTYSVRPTGEADTEEIVVRIRGTSRAIPAPGRDESDIDYDPEEDDSEEDEGESLNAWTDCETE